MTRRTGWRRWRGRRSGGHGVTAPVPRLVTLADDDTASTRVALSVSQPSVAEDAGAVTLTVTGTLDGAARPRATTVSVTVGDGTAQAPGDFAAQVVTALTIDAGQTSGTVDVTLTLVDDGVAEGAETVRVSGSTRAFGLAVDGADLTVTDNDMASTGVALSLLPDTVTEGGGERSVTVTATLDAGARAEATTVTVTVGSGGDSAVSGTDYDPVPSVRVTIDAASTSGTGSFSITPTNDTTSEGCGDGDGVGDDGGGSVGDGCDADDPRRRHRHRRGSRWRCSRTR